MAQRPCKDPTLFHLNKTTGRFSAWVRIPTDGNQRYYIGCYSTFHMAARAQDRANLFIDPNAAVNFKVSDYQDDSAMRASMAEKAFLKMLRDESRPVYRVVNKSACFAKFQRMEDHMEDLRRVTKFTIRQFVAHLANNPSNVPEINEAANTLLDIFSTHTAGTDHRIAAPERVAVAELAQNMEVTVAYYRASPKLDILAATPKKKRSPQTLKKDAADQANAGPPIKQESTRPQTRAYCKRKLEMQPVPCPFRRPRS